MVHVYPFADTPQENLDALTSLASSVTLGARIEGGYMRLKEVELLEVTYG